MIANRWQYARSVVTNSMEHYYTQPHPDVKQEWIIKAIAQPDHIEYDGDDFIL